MKYTREQIQIAVQELGYKLNKSLGAFVEGKYNKYWNRKWYDFKLGINYVIR